MFRSNFFSALMAVCIVSITMIACNKEEIFTSDLSLRTASNLETENLLPASKAFEAENMATNKRKCFMLNYPVSIVTPDGMETAVASKEALKAFYRNYKAEGGEKGELSFVYPIEVTLQDGTTQLVNSQEDMQAIKESCPSKGNKHCFKAVFPVTITTATGETETLEDRRDWRKFQKSVRMAIENGETVPAINFPIEITTEEGNVSITSQSELDVLRESCSQN